MKKKISRLLSVLLPVTWANTTTAQRINTLDPVFFPYGQTVKILRVWGQLRARVGNNSIGGFNCFLSFIEPSGGAIFADPITTTSSFVTTGKSFANVGTAFQTTFEDFFAGGFVFESGIFTRSGELVLGTVYDFILTFEIEEEIEIKE